MFDSALNHAHARAACLPPLASGGHDSIEGGCCVMEAISHAAGEPWGDSPECAGRALGAFLRTWNDDLPTGDRDTLLRPLIATASVGPVPSDGVEIRRAMMLVDWLVRVNAATWLDNAGLAREAAGLRRLPSVRYMDDLAPLGLHWHQINSAAKSAALRAAGARDAIAKSKAARRKWDISRTAWERAKAEIGASAGDAARSGACAVLGPDTLGGARSAAWEAARDSVKIMVLSGPEWPAIRSVRAELQSSAARLARRMIATGKDA